MTKRLAFALLFMVLAACEAPDRSASDDGSVSIEGRYDLVFRNAGYFELGILNFLVTQDQAYYLWFSSEVIVEPPNDVQPGANTYALEYGGRFAGVAFPGYQYQAVGFMRPDFREKYSTHPIANLPTTYDGKPVTVIRVISFGPPGKKLKKPESR
jgi:hypothetical protein